MNKKQLKLKELSIWKKFHITGCQNYVRRPKNVLVIHKGNSYAHEKAKFDVCWKLLKNNSKFITEAVHNKTNLRHDVVDITNGIIYEVETDPKRAERFKALAKDYEFEIVVVKLW